VFCGSSTKSNEAGGRKSCERYSCLIGPSKRIRMLFYLKFLKEDVAGFCHQVGERAVLQYIQGCCWILQWFKLSRWWVPATSTALQTWTRAATTVWVKSASSVQDELVEDFVCARPKKYNVVSKVKKKYFLHNIFALFIWRFRRGQPILNNLEGYHVWILKIE